MGHLLILNDNNNFNYSCGHNEPFASSENYFKFLSASDRSLRASRMSQMSQMTQMSHRP